MYFGVSVTNLPHHILEIKGHQATKEGKYALKNGGNPQRGNKGKSESERENPPNDSIVC